MAIVFLADIHGNFEALGACLDQARAGGADRLVFLGDYVGYGADPEAVTQRIMAEANAGAIAIGGNHDAAIADPRIQMNDTARRAIDWTRRHLSEASRRFLAGLPLTAREGQHLYVHAEASAPHAWTYVLDTHDAAGSMAATDASITFCGHVHEPAVYSRSMAGKVTCFTPIADVAIPLMTQRRWLVVLGSVGQPRDGNPAASFAVFDESRQEITFRRVPYDVDGAAAKIIAAGLPASLAERLKRGV